MKTKLTSLLLILFISQNIFAFDIKSDTIELQNEYLLVKIKRTGAELISFFDKKDGVEHLWQGEKASWNQHSPILFPIVGKLKGGKYTIDAKTYKMKNHGFALHSRFTLVSQTDLEAILLLTSSAETLKQYPFQFKLWIHYRLKGKRLDITYSVENKNTSEMYFSIGAHPGFNIPFHSGEKYEDYFLEFAKKETANRLPLTKKEGLLSHTIVKNYLDHSKILPLSHKMFKDRVVILEGLRSSSLRIRSENSKKGIKIGIKGFPLLGVWTSSKKDAPFVCIEPWYGVSDFIDTTGDFKKKKAIQTLAPAEKFDMNYYIEIVDL